MPKSKMKKTKWIQKANLKKGTLSRQLGVPIEENIPFDVLLTIKNAPIGEDVWLSIRGKTKQIKVTKLLKRRAVLALNLKNFKRNKKYKK